MIRKLLIGALALCLALGALAFVFRRDIAIMIAERATPTTPVAAHRAIEWAQGPQAPAEQSRPPNIVFILADDLGFNDISTFGGGVAGGRVRTPSIDALAASGAIFEQAYSGTASCAPSRAMIMTGRYPTRTGFEFTPTPDGMAQFISLLSRRGDPKRPQVIYETEHAKRMPPFQDQGLPGAEVTIAETLKTRGYHTVHIGKWHLGLGEEYGPNAQGFNESLIMASGLHMKENDPNAVNAKLDFDPIDRFLWKRMQFAASFNGGKWFEPGGYLADYWTDEAIKVIKANKHRPFFLNLSHWSVHTPLQATKADYDAVGDIQPHRLRVYAAMVRALDRSVGRITQALKDEGLLENTLIVFSSDNGAPGYIGLDDINKPYRGWKLTFFEGGVRVPLFLSWPGAIKPGTRVARPAAHIDLMPTLAAAAGAALPTDVAIDGQNLLPLLASDAPGPAPPRALFFQSGPYRMVRAGDWKLQESHKPKQAWLFDLSLDPTEQNNLAAARPDKVKELSALLDAHQKGARAPLYPYLVQGPVAIDQTLATPHKDGADYIYWPN
jgi:uncharacterized sulfatase